MPSTIWFQFISSPCLLLFCVHHPLWTGRYIIAHLAYLLPWVSHLWAFAFVATPLPGMTILLSADLNVMLKPLPPWNLIQLCQGSVVFLPLVIYHTYGSHGWLVSLNCLGFSPNNPSSERPPSLTDLKPVVSQLFAIPLSCLHHSTHTSDTFLFIYIYWVCVSPLE